MKSQKKSKHKQQTQPARNPAKSQAGKPSDQIEHSKYGKGRIVKELTRGGQKWLQVKFASDTLEFKANDPALRRIR